MKKKFLKQIFKAFAFSLVTLRKHSSLILVKILTGEFKMQRLEICLPTAEALSYCEVYVFNIFLFSLFFFSSFATIWNAAALCSVIRIKSTESEPMMAHGFYPINSTACAKMAGIVNTVYCENNP